MSDMRKVEITVSEGDKFLTVSIEHWAEGWEPKKFFELLDQAYSDMQDQFGEAGIE